MSTRVQWLGHACLLIESGGLQVLIDPFLTGNPKAAAQADTLKPDVILVSHGHEDHVGDTIAIAKSSGATVVTNFELGEWFQKEGLTKVHGMQHGGGHQVHPGLYVKLTLAFHGSTLPGGGYGGNPCGFLLKFADGTTIYDAADSGLFGDMALIGEEGLHLAILPIGDYYTMGPADSIRAVKLLTPKKVMPIHYNTFPLLAQDEHAWAARVKSETSAHPLTPQPGEWVEI